MLSLRVRKTTPHNCESNIDTQHVISILLFWGNQLTSEKWNKNCAILLKSSHFHGQGFEQNFQRKFWLTDFPY